MPGLILVADDDAGLRAELERVCRSAGHETIPASSGPEAVERAREARPDAVLLAARMAGGDGIEALPAIAAVPGRPSVILFAGPSDLASAGEAARRGAAELVEEPVRAEVLAAVLARTFRARAVRAERDRLRTELADRLFGPAVARSAAMRRLEEQVERVASTPRTTVLIAGEPGTDVERVARVVHERSSRGAGPFAALSCAGHAEARLEAALFGHEAGDGPAEPGLFAAAEGGTLFLGEVGALPPALQERLLDALQDRTVRRAGGSADRPVDVRAIASTHRDLEALVREGRFREDLYYRLNVMSLRVPPLRERAEDLQPLADGLLAAIGAELGRRFTGFDDEARAQLAAHSWPGNLRELRNVVEHAALRAEGGTIEAGHLDLGDAPAGRARFAHPGAVPPGSLPLGDRTLRSVEECLIRRVLEECDGNRSEAARLLGINRTTLYNKLERYGLRAE